MLEPEHRQQDRNDLAQMLRELRKAAGLSGERLAVRAAMSQSKISRIESGRTLPTVVDVQRIIRALDIPAEVGQQLLSLARTANVDYASWRSYARVGIWRKQAEIKALAESSSVVRQFLPAVPSGLLQIPEYARAALTPAVEGKPARDVDRAVRARLESQEALDDESRQFVFLLTEQALRLRRADTDVMVKQLQHIAELSTRPNVKVAVLPSDVLVRASPLNVFVVYDDRLVVVELFSGEVALRDPKDIAYHQNLFAHFLERAAVDDDARRILEMVALDFMRLPD